MAGKPKAPGAVPVIPWADPALWEEANAALRRIIKKHGPALSGVKAHSAEIRRLLESTASQTQDLCLKTCPHCPDPCCAHAKVWLDFPDLLFLHLEGISGPPRQLRSHMEGPCAFLGRRGCTLDRLSRPFVCFWYFCPPQTLRLSRTPARIKQTLDAAVSSIKLHRKAMEEELIRIAFE